ncbi:putative DNA / pantothenate metabolism flavoprotein [Babesia bovis T2Bo]|uniref:putative DNA / pantothenate metabolism flavoprotein n=1 Tax=Babesia bovis T2Bo TaxID=484906 RepID=UPI001C34E463|nr:putative DNA / pantothenate metabolism flavoprotein [Babesia bovis T2Bo]EDO08188.2 putative DNA / pantothenate metabolism flavoprotein [Babesia bovis T2Bo]
MTADSAALEATVRKGLDAGKVAVVTSGGTCVPLDGFGVRTMDNFSTGRRGSRIAEELLRRGYYVIFIYRTGSHLPFLRAISECGGALGLLDAMHLDDDGQIKFVPPEERMPQITRAVKDYHKYKSKLFTIAFKLVSEYTNALDMVCRIIHANPSAAMFFLAAAVSDFKVADDMLPRNKVSSGSDMTLYFTRMDKVRNIVRDILGNKPVLCCFKLETDESIAVQKAKTLLQGPTYADAVVLNMLDQRYNTVELIFAQGDSIRLEAKNGDIDEGIVDLLLELHERKKNMLHKE